ncbi:MAG: tetrathionate reductase subunit B [Candidatus Binatia bacterium]|jgi:tetrathionate reductase subunit B
MSDKKSQDLPWEKVGKEHARKLKRAGILVDLQRCVGCHSCSISCKTEHSVPLGNFRNRTHYLQREAENQISHIPTLCMQCKDAPCITACPTSALGRLEDGRVVVNDERCNGTKACIPACPYGAISINKETGRAEKCDLCQQRTDVGLEPACVDACPTEALRYGDMDDPEDPVAKYAKEKKATQFRADAGTDPTVVYVGVESWMEERVTSVQRGDDEDGIVYE